MIDKEIVSKDIWMDYPEYEDKFIYPQTTYNGFYKKTPNEKSTTAVKAQALDLGPLITVGTTVKPPKAETVDLEDLLAEADLQPMEKTVEEPEPDSIEIEKLETYLKGFAESKFKFCGKSLDKLDHLELQALIGMLLASNRRASELTEEMKERIRANTNIPHFTI